jgi:PAS domain S-box-containing protein
MNTNTPPSQNPSTYSNHPPPPPSSDQSTLYLKRPPTSNSGSPSLQPPATKQLKHSLFGSGRTPFSHGLDAGHQGRPDRQELVVNTENVSEAHHIPSVAGNVSFLEAAATVVADPDVMTHSRIPIPGRNVPTGSIPIRASPLANRQGSEQNVAARPRAPSDPRRPPGSQLLNSIGLTEYLQFDDRPTFVVDILDAAHATAPGLHLLFENNALKARLSVLDHVKGISEDPTLLLDLGTPFADFKAWVLSPLTDPDIVTIFPFGGYLWHTCLLRKRLRVIHGRQHINSSSTSNETHIRPGMQQYKGLGSISSSVVPVRSDLASPSYFDIPSRFSHDLPRTLQNLVNSDISPGSQEDLSPTSHDVTKYKDLISGSISPTPEEMDLPSHISLNGDVAVVKDLDQQGFFDWTRLPMSSSLPPHVQFARSINWGTTSLGPIEQWPVELRGMCNLIMASPHPSAMYWGRDHVAIYNEAYVLLAGQKHPELMGSRYRDAWAEIWHALEDVFDNAFENAQATMKDDDCLFLFRNGFLEETYFSWSIIPLIGDNGAVVGLYNPAFEKTRRKIAERRMLTLREIGERTAAARQVNQFWGLLLEGFEYNELDAPLVLVYSLSDDLADNETGSSGSSGAASNKVCYLEGALGIPPDHLAAPPVIDMKSSTNGFASSFRQALTTDRPIVLRVDDGTLDANMLEGIEWRGFGDPSRVVVIAPIHPTTGESTLGFLVMGTNPRRPYDEDYDLFIQLLGRQLATSIASVVLFEEEIRKGERAAQLAAQDRIELNNQLVARTQQAVEAENKFTRMAELAPVGMFIANIDGKITFVNDAWYDISSYPRDVQVRDEWIKYIVEEDQPKVMEMWNTMLVKRRPVSMEFRFTTPWRDRLGKKGPTWVLTSISPERNDDGNLERIFGSMTDISAQKFAENLQTRRMEEAVELKRQQERYIDTTSHEMRNPLSAILQSADSITTSLAELRILDGITENQKDIIDTTIDSAQTITLCAQHQKRIVDDVLTLSKLDSAMMAVTPVDANPSVVVHKVLKMFEAELKTADITFELKFDSSFSSLGIDWVRLDPHRLSQVLINLMTNAIKFTTTQETRVIRMHVAASADKPSKEDKWKLTYIPSRSSRDNDVTAGAEWGLGDHLYIHFAVQDTGRGLDDLEKKQLFQRFSQASPRTHVTYGGSGLGLFISRELVELQGGEIGVASESEKGSVFAFYVKARRCSNPPVEIDEDPQASPSQSRKGSKASGLVGTNSRIHTPTSRVLSLSEPTQSSKTTVAQTKPLHVLVVEDNIINQKVLATQLRKIGCVVYVANHGGEAIDQIRLSKFSRDRVKDGMEIDVVLMDLEMPVMDGQTCARTLREMQNNGELVAHIPVIAVTANARAEQIEMTLKSGIDDVVSKPFRIHELLPKMQDNIAKFAGQPENARYT